MHSCFDTFRLFWSPKMSEEDRSNDIVDTTDCYEAVSTFRNMKNILFWVIFFCLIILQGLFWLEHTGMIDKSDYPQAPGQAVYPVTIDTTETSEQSAPVDIIEAQAEIATEDTSVDDQIAVTESQLSEIAAPDAASDKAADTEEKPAKKFKMFVPKSRQVVCTIKICNFILIIAATLYTLVLLMCIKISLVGRLGGLRHISKAFFRAMFAYILLLPWQSFLPGIIAGAIYTPKELLCDPAAAQGAALFAGWLYYARFVGLGGFTFLLIVFAQFRSMRWTKATLRRRGIVH